MACDSFMPMFWKCWSRKQALVICNAGIHFQYDGMLIFLPNLMCFGRKFEDKLTVFNLSIVFSVIYDRNLEDLDKTLESVAENSGVLGQRLFLKKISLVS